MSNLLASMRASATALDALQRATSAAGNNVANASTPGYAKQTLPMQAVNFNPELGLAGGVVPARMVSSRDEFVESSVRQEASLVAGAQEMATQTAYIDSTFSLTDSTGISPNLDQFFTAAGAWTVSPLSTSSKENVLAAAAEVAAAFNKTANDIERAGMNAEVRIGSTLEAVSDLANRIRQHNVDIRNGGAGDAGVDASMHADLEQLSSLVGIQAVWQPDGTATVLMGKETPLVVGDKAFDLQVVADPAPATPDLAGAVPSIHILDQAGADVTRTVTGGQLGALVEFRNKTVPSYLGSTAGAGELNRMAKAFADRVNAIMSDGDPDPTASVPMFLYANDVSAAQSLRVNPDLTAVGMSAQDSTAGNGRPLQLSGLAHPWNGEDMIDGISYMTFAGKLSASAGRLAGDAKAALDSHKQMLAQVHTMRDQVSGVSLDEEAVSLTQSQRAYEATARMVSILDDILKTAVNIGRA